MAATSMRAHTHTPLQIINRGNHFMRPLRSSFSGKQKSAVELLQESKYLYVKSETVLDHQQKLKFSNTEALHSPIVKVRGPPVPPKSAQLRRSYNSSASSTDQLQAKLRKLLNADSKENLIEDSNISEEVKKSPQQHQHRSNSQKHNKQKTHGNPVHHKSMPNLHADVDTSSESSEPVSCEYQLYISNRKSSSPRQSTYDNSVESSASRSKPVSSQASSRSHSSSGGVRRGLAPVSPVKSSISYGGCVSITDRRPDTMWLDDGDSDDGTRLRPILRSKSDVGHRCTKLTPVPLPPLTLADLDMFFEQLGLNSSDFQSMTKPNSQTSSPVFFSDTSSVDSQTVCANNQSVGGGGSEGASSVGELPSIVERNARIIKWLCNCRKAQLSMPAAVS